MTQQSPHLPTANPWFETAITYEGVGRATFGAPKGFLEGPSRICINELEETSIEMCVERSDCEKDLSFGLLEFLSGSLPEEVEGKKRLIIGGDPGNGNPCDRVEIQTPTGIYQTVGKVLCTGHSFGSKQPTTVKFHPLRAQFRSRESQKPAYWVIPLLNFRSEMVQCAPDLDKHPLRIFPTPVAPNNLIGDEALIARFQLNSKNQLIVFESHGEHGFIERLPDYKERIERLENHRDRHLLTAVMVGTIGDHPAGDFDSIEEWFPFEFPRILELASGGRVGMPWIETRDKSAQIVSRFHAGFGYPAYRKGHTAIDERVNTGVGSLLSGCHKSGVFRQTALKVAAKHLIRAGHREGTIEDDIVNLSIAFDTLNEFFDLKKMRKEDNLSEEIEGKVKECLKETAKRIRDLASETLDSEDPSKLKTIAERVSSAPFRGPSFGKQMLRLLHLFDLPDGEILTDFCDQHAPFGGIPWTTLIAKSRSIVVHSGFFDFQDGKHQIDDLVALKSHLQDILFRVLLKTLEYEGTYQPPVWKWAGCAGLDWVTKDTPASSLGYS